MVAVFLEHLRQFLTGADSQVLGNKVRRDRQRVSGLRFDFDAAIIVNVLFNERSFGSFQLLPIGGRFIGAVGRFGHFCHHAGADCEVNRVDVIQRRVFALIQPIAPSVTVLDSQIADAGALSPVQKTSHRFPANVNHACVAVDLPDGPRTNDARVGPCGSEFVAMLKRKRSVTGKRTARTLRLHQLAIPLGEKRADIGVVSRRRDVGLCVAGPAHAFIALRAIGGQVDKVSPLRPKDVAVKLIHHRVRTGEGAGHRRVRMQHQPGHRFQSRLLGKICQFDELKTVRRELRRENFSLDIAFANVKICRACLPQVLCHQPPVGV